MINKIIRSIGFTKTETKAIVFLLVVFLTGLMYKYLIKGGVEENNTPMFNYSEQDSMFYSAVYPEADTETISNLLNKDIDYKQEVLDFNTPVFTAKRIDQLKEKSINLNKAGINDLIRLPGIGEATARNIIKYRDTNGNFRNLEELMDVQRIGEKRFNQIKKYVFIE